MDTMLYADCRDYLSTSLARWMASHHLNAQAAEAIVHLHLREDAYVMPLQVDVAGQHALLAAPQLPGDLSDQLLRYVAFEPIDGFEGVFRIFARTLLNRSGVADLVGRGGNAPPGPTRSHVPPRIAGVLDGLASVDTLRDACAYDRLLEILEGVAESHLRHDGALGFEAGDLHALRRLRQEGEASLGRSVKDLAPQIGGHWGWTRWVRGLHFGLAHFRRRYDFDIEAFWAAVRTAEGSADGSVALAKQLVADMKEMRLPLAMSFFGDLGRSAFAKPDKHVTDALATFEGRKVSAVRGFSALQRHAGEAGVSPRCLDKVFFLAGSGNFYLTGLDLKGALKPGLLDTLRAI